MSSHGSPVSTARVPRARLLDPEERRRRDRAWLDDGADEGTPVPTVSRSPLALPVVPSIDEMRQMLAQSAPEQESLPSRRSNALTPRHQVDYDLDPLDDLDDDKTAPSTVSDAARQLHVEHLVKDLGASSHTAQLLAQDAVESLGRVWRYDALLARLLNGSPVGRLDDIRRLEISREIAHRAVVRDIEAIRLLKMPAGGVQVQVAAAASEGGHIDVNVGPPRPIPKRRVR